MTALADRPHIMETEHFEEAARILARLEEGARLELIDGKVRSKAMPDGDHGRIIQWLTSHLHAAQAGALPRSEPGPEGGDLPRGPPSSGRLARAVRCLRGPGEWADPDPVLMVVEVTSHDSDTDQRDRVEKPRAYARTGIPLYLLIDRQACRIVVYSEPDDGSYETVHTVPFGKTLHLPDPVGITLETEPLKDWVN